MSAVPFGAQEASARFCTKCGTKVSKPWIRITTSIALGILASLWWVLRTILITARPRARSYIRRVFLGWSEAKSLTRGAYVPEVRLANEHLRPPKYFARPVARNCFTLSAVTSDFDDSLLRYRMEVLNGTKERKDRGLFERPMGSSIWWIHYHDANGRKHRERGGNKTEARALYMRRKTEIKAGTWTAPGDRGMPQSAAGVADGRPSTTLGDFALAWLKERAPHLTPAVREDYDRLLRFHVFDLPLARRRLAEIHDGDISRLVHDLSAKTTRAHKPLSPRRVNMVVARLRTIFATARRRKLVSDDPDAVRRESPRAQVGG